MSVGWCEVWDGVKERVGWCKGECGMVLRGVWDGVRCEGECRMLRALVLI